MDTYRSAPTEVRKVFVFAIDLHPHNYIDPCFNNHALPHPWDCWSALRPLIDLLLSIANRHTNDIVLNETAHAKQAFG